MIKHTHYVDTIAEKIVLIHHEYFFEKVLSATVSSTDYLTDPLVLQSLNQLIDQFWDELFDTKSNPYWNEVTSRIQNTF
ncbi:hypothetical protein [Paenibacillus sp. FSL L8-0709]|uniref:hypothetical protein n=1 Tax=Paenibacillus sp. FSL L8-0709 TaxID=2975312 RepID=UPI0030F5E03D